MTAITYKLDSDPVWLKNAFDDLGIKELSGSKHNKRVLEMFQTAGHPEVKNDETAWCSAAMNTWFVEGGLKGTGSLMARSWRTWGKELPLNKKAPRGAVVVFWRGSKNAPTGHVALVLEDDGTYITHIGGNQSDSVNVSRTLKSKALAFRWPNTAGNSKTIQAIGGSSAALISSDGFNKASTTVSDNSDSISNALSVAQPYVEQLGTMLHWATYVSIALGIFLAGWAAYRHYKNNIRS